MFHGSQNLSCSCHTEKTSWDQKKWFLRIITTNHRASYRRSGEEIENIIVNTRVSWFFMFFLVFIHQGTKMINMK